MFRDKLNNVHIESEEPLITPAQLAQELPISEHALEFVAEARETISNILHRRDHRLLLVCGPCSIHDVDAAKTYATKLKELHEASKDTIYVVMRVYFEKPRATLGWKGLLNDPHLDGTFDIEAGMRKARELLIWLAELELPVATEALDPINPQYFAELFSWAAIGSRASESQSHREMASGLSMPVGFKNGVNGDLNIVVNALQSAATAHSFVGISKEGRVSRINTTGNPDCHVILRGGNHPNYDSVCVADCETLLEDANLSASLMIDCSHANSNFDYRRQPLVAKNVVNQILEGNQSIIGFMLESNLFAGQQVSDGKTSEQLQFGVSITDGCIDWETTEELINHTRQKLITVLPMRLNKYHDPDL